MSTLERQELRESNYTVCGDTVRDSEESLLPFWINSGLLCNESNMYLLLLLESEGWLIRNGAATRTMRFSCINWTKIYHHAKLPEWQRQFLVTTTTSACSRQHVRKCTASRNQQETRKQTGGSVLIRRGNFIYNTWCWQGVSSSASILQGWSARLRIYCTVFGNQDCSGTINTRLKQQILSLFLASFFPYFLIKWYKQQYKIFVLLTIYKKSLLTR